MSTNKNIFNLKDKEQKLVINRVKASIHAGLRPRKGRYIVVSNRPAKSRSEYDTGESMRPLLPVTASHYPSNREYQGQSIIQARVETPTTSCCITLFIQPRVPWLEREWRPLLPVVASHYSSNREYHGKSMTQARIETPTTSCCVTLSIQRRVSRPEYNIGESGDPYYQFLRHTILPTESNKAKQRVDSPTTSYCVTRSIPPRVSRPEYNIGESGDPYYQFLRHTILPTESNKAKSKIHARVEIPTTSCCVTLSFQLRVTRQGYNTAKGGYPYYQLLRHTIHPTESIKARYDTGKNGDPYYHLMRHTIHPTESIMARCHTICPTMSIKDRVRYTQEWRSLLPVVAIKVRVFYMRDWRPLLLVVASHYPSNGEYHGQRMTQAGVETLITNCSVTPSIQLRASRSEYYTCEIVASHYPSNGEYHGKGMTQAGVETLITNCSVRVETHTTFWCVTRSIQPRASRLEYYACESGDPYYQFLRHTIHPTESIKARYQVHSMIQVRVETHTTCWCVTLSIQPRFSWLKYDIDYSTHPYNLSMRHTIHPGISKPEYDIGWTITARYNPSLYHAIIPASMNTVDLSASSYIEVNVTNLYENSFVVLYSSGKHYYGQTIIQTGELPPFSGHYVTLSAGLQYQNHTIMQTGVLPLPPFTTSHYLSGLQYQNHTIMQTGVQPPFSGHYVTLSAWPTVSKSHYNADRSATPTTSHYVTLSLWPSVSKSHYNADRGATPTTSHYVTLSFWPSVSKSHYNAHQGATPFFRSLLATSHYLSGLQYQNHTTMHTGVLPPFSGHYVTLSAWPTVSKSHYNADLITSHYLSGLQYQNHTIMQTVVLPLPPVITSHYLSDLQYQNHTTIHTGVLPLPPVATSHFLFRLKYQNHTIMQTGVLPLPPVATSHYLSGLQYQNHTTMHTGVLPPFSGHYVTLSAWPSVSKSHYNAHRGATPFFRSLRHTICLAFSIKITLQCTPECYPLFPVTTSHYLPGLQYQNHTTMHTGVLPFFRSLRHTICGLQYQNHTIMQTECYPYHQSLRHTIFLAFSIKITLQCTPGCYPLFPVTTSHYLPGLQYQNHTTMHTGVLPPFSGHYVTLSAWPSVSKSHYNADRSATPTTSRYVTLSFWPSVSKSHYNAHRGATTFFRSLLSKSHYNAHRCYPFRHIISAWLLPIHYECYPYHQSLRHTIFLAFSIKITTMHRGAPFSGHYVTLSLWPSCYPYHQSLRHTIFLAFSIKITLQCTPGCYPLFPVTTSHYLPGLQYQNHTIMQTVVLPLPPVITSHYLSDLQYQNHTTIHTGVLPLPPVATSHFLFRLKYQNHTIMQTGVLPLPPVATSHYLSGLQYQNHTTMHTGVLPPFSGHYVTLSAWPSVSKSHYNADRSATPTTSRYVTLYFWPSVSKSHYNAHRGATPFFRSLRHTICLAFSIKITLQCTPGCYPLFPVTMSHYLPGLQYQNHTIMRTGVLPLPPVATSHYLSGLQYQNHTTMHTGVLPPFSGHYVTLSAWPSVSKSHYNAHRGATPFFRRYVTLTFWPSVSKSHYNAHRGDTPFFRSLRHTIFCYPYHQSLRHTIFLAFSIKITLQCTPGCYPLFPVTTSHYLPGLQYQNHTIMQTVVLPLPPVATSHYLSGLQYQNHTIMHTGVLPPFSGHYVTLSAWPLLPKLHYNADRSATPTTSRYVTLSFWPSVSKSHYNAHRGATPFFRSLRHTIFVAFIATSHYLSSLQYQNHTTMHTGVLPPFFGHYVTLSAWPTVSKSHYNADRSATPTNSHYVTLSFWPSCYPYHQSLRHTIFLTFSIKITLQSTPGCYPYHQPGCYPYHQSLRHTIFLAFSIKITLQCTPGCYPLFPVTKSHYLPGLYYQNYTIMHTGVLPPFSVSKSHYNAHRCYPLFPVTTSHYLPDLHYQNYTIMRTGVLPPPVATSHYLSGLQYQNHTTCTPGCYPLFPVTTSHYLSGLQYQNHTTMHTGVLPPFSGHYVTLSAWPLLPKYTIMRTGVLPLPPVATSHSLPGLQYQNHTTMHTGVLPPFSGHYVTLSAWPLLPKLHYNADRSATPTTSRYVTLSFWPSVSKSHYNAHRGATPFFRIKITLQCTPGCYPLFPVTTSHYLPGLQYQNHTIMQTVVLPLPPVATSHFLFRLKYQNHTIMQTGVLPLPPVMTSHYLSGLQYQNHTIMQTVVLPLPPVITSHYLSDLQYQNHTTIHTGVLPLPPVSTSHFLFCLKYQNHTIMQTGVLPLPPVATSHYLSGLQYQNHTTMHTGVLPPFSGH
ncbi:hypothetical protein J6590_021048 [Homalodisca vitripennis]|nr:hypothetical protein J6590_021048 [Homalodisca vitripennis]